MISLPSPLHPAIVHFPIVLLLLGAGVTVAAAVFRRWYLPTLAAAILSIGALGAIAAVITGEQEAEMAGELSPQAEKVLDEHEEMAETTRNAAIIAALVAIASAALFQFPAVARGVGVLAALVALGAAYFVAQTGHYGGQLVYKQGVGVNISAGQAGTGPALDVPKDEDGRHGD